MKNQIRTREGREKQVLVIPGMGYLRTYAGTQYLIEELVDNHVAVEVLLRCGVSQAEEYRKFPYRITLWVEDESAGLFKKRLSGIGFRMFMIFKAMLKKNILITESVWLRELALVKRIKPAIRAIQYCQELQLTTDYPDHKYARIYKRYARVPDIVIDVDPYRAMMREARAALPQTPFVLINTLPVKNILDKAPSGTLARLAGVTFPEGIPILLHAGGIGKEKPLERVIDAISLCREDVFFLAFCNGAEDDILRLVEYAKKKLVSGRFCIRRAVQRDLLMPSMSEADIGVVDYTYSVEPTLNQKYCAPTKLFEFMAYGLAVLGSNNESLREIVEGRGIGKCAKEDSIEALAEALSAILKDHGRIKNMKACGLDLFINEYSYEKKCAPVVKALVGAMR